MPATHPAARWLASVPCAVLLVGLIASLVAVARTPVATGTPSDAPDDWPQFHGPRRDNMSTETGTLLWEYPHEVRYESNCTSPVYHDGYLILFGTWGRGATLLKLTVTDGACTADEVWRTIELDNEHGGVILLDGYLYGHADGNHKDRHLACVEMRTGKTMWTARELTGTRSASLTFADGMLYLMTDRREVALIRPNPEHLEVVSQFMLPNGGKGASYAHPVVCGGRLYPRHGDFLYAYDVRAGA